MLTHLSRIAVATALCVPSLVYGDATVVVDRQAGPRATADFRFPEMNSPVQDDAASGGKWSVISGTPDPAGGGIAKLHDGQLPRSSDQPSENFFFAPATEGGRVQLDLERAIDVSEIRSYSWHTAERAPQVYTVFGCDPKDGDNVQLKPSATIDPTTCGWTKIASVDTRQSNVDGRLRPSDRNSADRRLRPAAFGGQVGIGISADKNDAETNLGRFRYLLFDIAPAQPNARFSNTFFSEIDVLEDGAPVTPAEPIVMAGIETYAIADGKYEFTMDTSGCPDLTRWADQELAPVVQEWYPKIVELLASDGYEPPQNFHIHISPSMDGVAETAGTQVTCSADWYRRNLQGEAKGATVHELVHVVQQYGAARRTNRRTAPTPGWVVEGVADYVRWHLYEPASERGGVTGRRPASLKYDASYRDTAAFLAWVIANETPDLLAKLNAAARTGTYSDAFWKQTTGKTAEELSAAWHADLVK